MPITEEQDVSQATADAEEHHLLPAATAQACDLNVSVLASGVNAMENLSTRCSFESPFHAAQACCTLK